MPKMVPFLWFENQAAEAAKFYTSVFKAKNSKIISTSHYGDGAPVKKGTVMTVKFKIFGQEMLALNGGPHYKFSGAISFVIFVKTQREFDAYWKKLTSGGGHPIMCGWLNDKYGITWQITPEILPKLLADKNPEKAMRTQQAMMRMQRLDIKALIKAHAGK